MIFLTDSDDNILTAAVFNFTVTFVCICQKCNTIQFWCVLQGSDGFEKHMDRLMELTEYMVKRIKSMPDKFYLILEPELVNVSFWYVPTRLRSMQHGPEREKLLGQVSKCDQSQ